MSRQSCTVELQEAGKRLFVFLPFEPDQIWGTKQRHHVTGSLNGHPIRGALDRVDDKATLVLGPAWLRNTGLKAGMHVELILQPEGPQTDALADDLLAALNAAPEARLFFESLATFYRKGYLRWVDGARKAEVRAARIAEMVELLHAGKKERSREA